MSPLLVLGVAAAGGAGAVARVVVDAAVTSRSPARLREVPVGTLLVNALGSLLLGALTGLALHGPGRAEWLLVLGTGLCGGFTTFGSPCWQAADLVLHRRWAAAASVAAANLLLSLAAAAAGLALGR